jgi:hypothetical protein
MKDIKKNATVKSKVKLRNNKETPFNIDLNYSEEYDSFNIKVKKDVGFMSYTDSLQGLPLEVVQKLNEMLEEVLIKAGSETEMKEDLEVELGAEPNPSHSSRSHEGSVKIKTYRVKVKSLSEAQNEVRGFIEENDLGGGNFNGGDLFSHGKKIGRVSPNGRLFNLKDEPMKMSNGGDFQAGVYAKGGSLQAHGIELGDTFVKTISGNIQKIKDKNGKIVYVDLSTGERDSQPPLPFADGGFMADIYVKGGSLEDRIKKLEDKKSDLESKLFEAKLKTNEKWNNIGWGSGMRRSKLNVSTSREDSLKERIKVIEEEIYETKKTLLPFADGGGIGIEEDIDMTDDKVLRVRKPAMPERKLSNLELAEKHNSGAYEFMGKDKMSIGGGVGIGYGIPKEDLENYKIVEVIEKEVSIDYNNLEKSKYIILAKPIVNNYKNKFNEPKVFIVTKNKNIYTIDNVNTIKFNEIKKDIDKNNLSYSRYGYLKILLKGGGVGLIGNQKRIDMNHNGKIDAEDFKLLRSSMNGAWRNERKHVNHNEDYEVRYAKPRPNRTGYKGKRKFGDGGGISNFERLSRVVAKNYEGKRVKPKYQKEYGKVYSKSEAKEVGNKVAGKVKSMQKAESGAEVKKGNKGGVMTLAKQIRKEGESWQDALKRAGQQLK